MTMDVTDLAARRARMLEAMAAPRRHPKDTVRGDPKGPHRHRYRYNGRTLCVCAKTRSYS